MRYIDNLDTRVVHTELPAGTDDEQPVIVGMFGHITDANAFARSYSEDSAGLCVIEQKTASGKWECEGVFWDEDFTAEARAAIKKFPADAQEVFAGMVK